MAATTPIKIDPETDRLVADAAHFLGRTKKSIVEAAVREYVEAHRAELDGGMRASAARIAPRRPVGALEARLAERRRQLVSELVALGASNVRVFGSVARGESGPDSDVDLLVDLSDDVGLFAVEAMRGAAERLLEAPVDVVPSSGLKPAIAARVLAEARAL